MKLNKRVSSFFLIGILIGSIATYLIFNQKLNSQKVLTKRILNNSIQSMKASQELANSCSDAYKTATACVSNLKTCNVKEQAKKLDEFNARRKRADPQIDWMNQDMIKIIEEVSANR